jgi:hypothetical protein
MNLAAVDFGHPKSTAGLQITSSSLEQFARGSACIPQPERPRNSQSSRYNSHRTNEKVSPKSFAQNILRISPLNSKILLVV